MEATMERRQSDRKRTLRSGKITFNNRRSVVDCTIRNMSDTGACLIVNATSGIPNEFELMVGGDAEPIKCMRMWEAGQQIGVSFPASRAEPIQIESWMTEGGLALGAGRDLVRNEMLALRAALDEVSFGIVLLDKELRAQFINRAFRRMWRLNDNKANSKPAFVALMYHGRDTRAYAVSDDELDSYVAARVAHVKAGNIAPVDIRLKSGDVIRFQCVVLPGGGRMLSYTYVTDIVRRNDELEMLKGALNCVDQGIILLDANLQAQFMNQSVRELWKVSDEQADRKPHYAELVNDAHFTHIYGVPENELDDFIARRIATIKSGAATPVDIETRDGRVIRSQCAVLPSGGRMLTYNDVTDLVRQARNLEEFATTDELTSLFNRRHILSLVQAEWERLQRYYSKFSVIALDIDNFKSINDRFGHAAGDEALRHVAGLVVTDLRAVDKVGRQGGDELLVLLPETGLEEANRAAERICKAVRSHPLQIDGASVLMTVSCGVAEASVSMSGAEALLRQADRALYLAKANGRNQAQSITRDDSTLKDAAE
jgi:diguanylate cyclase (GGDEF)-like protein